MGELFLLPGSLSQYLGSLFRFSGSLCAIKGHFSHTTLLLCAENALISYIGSLKELICALNVVFLRTLKVLCVKNG